MKQPQNMITKDDENKRGLTDIKDIRKISMLFFKRTKIQPIEVKVK